MDPADLAARYPRLWHMAEDGAWPSIRDHGLLSTSALLDLYGVTGEAREALEARRRPDGVRLERPGLPGAVVRDQKPLSEAGLGRCLTDGLTPAAWLRLLNARVFFWLNPERLRKLVCAKPYRALAHTVLTLDTASLVAAHADRIELSPINSGTTFRFPAPRGRGTFVRLLDCPYVEWAKKRGAADAIVELSVLGGVRDITRHVLAVHRARCGASVETIWQRPGAEGVEPPL